uniref:SKA2 domain-containing protein n=1 Tax=Bursaphelenchus xylophilus TaxID=6326 RepID=A0A1I7SI75_BURXY
HFYKDLVNEIEDEIQLRINHQNINQNLEQLDERVRTAAASGNTADALDMLSKLELEVELLKKQCKLPRRYVACLVEGSPTATPSKRRKILLKITNSVTTIIKVVEDELQRQNQLKPELPSTSYEAGAYQTAGSDSDFGELHRKLSALQSQTSDVEASQTTISELPTPVPEERDERLENVLMAAGDLQQTLQEIIHDKDAKKENYEEILHKAREVRSGLEQALDKIDAEPIKSPITLMYREQILDRIQGILVSPYLH